MSGGVTAYIGLGSNLDNPVDQIRAALRELNKLPQSRLLLQSSLYQSAPMGPPDQPDYINAVAALETHLLADELLSALQMLESQHQRVRQTRWGPRTLDLDLLLYGDQVINSEHLVVPHPGLAERLFVLQPLFEIAPLLVLPNNQAVAELFKQCAECSGGGLRRLD
ncbi:MAG TPA: 2-amino-4-hydroxy-6-hydroxymethyldihydropteridine diphosphokinase [Candidatus Tenderia electrophaga]|uniref:2-amino-4-hydroxy-6-hydroxymethyldihydropteridine pyrophosphokinase n=1 Tax=Candidatus Tenderia electrophaga TaxID=1748243 RepID=A0A832N3W9_9GAMM|nr:2-amino-4-hydroxy-6-hydroxymethyldihydropteridine diphosphokinase [Candidatus Tenderia electrophaga]